MQTLFLRILFHYWYFRQPPWDTGVSPPELLEFMEKHGPGRAIDIGCGTGTNIITLGNAGWKVTGVDFAPRAIKLARQKLKKADIQAELLVRDATKLERISGPFDLAFDLGCFHTIPQNGKAEYLTQLNRILAPSGFWLMYGFLHSDPLRAGHGLVEADIRAISSQMTLLSRQEGFDDHRARSSAWFLFQKQT
ncbi:MAG: class I SAM-dependent methyltransferase [Anaerolineales bacterium]